MRLERGKTYRAETAAGKQITFTVLLAEEGWPKVDLDSAEGPEPNVWLNTGLLLWISSEQRQGEALSKAADEVIEALERSTENRPPAS